MLRTILTVAAIWTLGTFVASIHPIPWAWWAIMAAIGCVVITFHPAGRIQAVIGGTFLTTLIVHGAYGISVEMARNVNTDAYLKSLYILNFLRVSLCVAWGMGVGVKMVRLRMLARRRAAVAGPHLAHMD